MKNYIITICILLVSFTATACEICGCGTGNYYIGLLPQFSRSFLGTRYQFSSFHTSIKGDASQYSNDLFQTIEVWGGINIGNKWQVLALVPFNFIHQASDDGTSNANGIGDIAVLGNYKIFDNTSVTKNKKLIKQQVWMGAGIKLATGKFTIDPNDPAFIALANTQVGSGSTDFMLNAMYNISINRFGVSTSARYKINTTNSDHYFFGNSFSANSIAYRAITAGKKIITPNAGLMYEHSEANQSANQKIVETGGYLLSSVAGVEVNAKKITIGCNAQLPLSQSFASGQTTTKLRGMFHVTFSL